MAPEITASSALAEQLHALSNYAIEEAVIASLLLKNELYFDLPLPLKTSDFYHTLTRRVFECIQKRAAESKLFDLVSVSGDLAGQGTLELIGGAPALAGLINSAARTTAFIEYAQLLTDLSQKREMLVSLKQAISDILSPIPRQETLTRLEQLIFSATQSHSKTKVFPLEITVPDTIKAIEERTSGAPTNFIMTGLTLLDEYLLGLRPGQLIIVAAQPGMGKTSLAMNIMLHTALKQAKGALFISLEMTKLEVTERFLSALCEIDSQNLKKGHLSGQNWQSLYDGAETLSKLPIQVIDQSITPLEAISQARKLKIQASQKGSHPIDLIVVDYLQIMQSGERIDNSVTEITKISNALKRMAKELEVPVIALSQLSKEGYRKGPSDEFKAPSLADLKGSGSIEADADAVLLLSRGAPQAAMDSRAPQVCRVRIEKNRSGPQGQIDLIWRGEFTRFYDLEPKHQGTYDV